MELTNTRQWRGRNGAGLLARLTFAPYCGLSLPATTDDFDSLRDAAARRLRRARRRGFPVVTLARGAQWEIGEPDGCVMVPDSCGVLTLAPAPFAFSCGECGEDHQTREEAAECCAGRYDWDTDGCEV